MKIIGYKPSQDGNLQGLLVLKSKRNLSVKERWALASSMHKQGLTKKFDPTEQGPEQSSWLAGPWIVQTKLTSAQLQNAFQTEWQKHGIQTAWFFQAESTGKKPPQANIEILETLDIEDEPGMIHFLVRSDKGMRLMPKYSAGCRLEIHKKDKDTYMDEEVESQKVLVVDTIPEDGYVYVLTQDLEVGRIKPTISNDEDDDDFEEQDDDVPSSSDEDWIAPLAPKLATPFPVKGYPDIIEIFHYEMETNGEFQAELKFKSKLSEADEALISQFFGFWLGQYSEAVWRDISINFAKQSVTFWMDRFFPKTGSELDHLRRFLKMTMQLHQVNPIDSVSLK